MTSVAVVIPFRDRGFDPLRKANLDRVVQQWESYELPVHVVSDGRTGDEQFNRSAAYNTGIDSTLADVIVFAEADLLVPHQQILDAVEIAASKDVLVIPFSEFMAMSEQDSELVRERKIDPAQANAEQIRGKRQSIGAVNVVSRRCLAKIGGYYDEEFEGHAYDDDAMERAFSICCGPTQFVDGPGWHQYHIPGAFFATPGSTVADREATERNRRRWLLYRAARTSGQIRELTRRK